MKKIPIGCRLPEENHADLFVLSRLKGTTMSKQLLIAINKYIDEYRDQIAEFVSVSPEK